MKPALSLLLHPLIVLTALLLAPLATLHGTDAKSLLNQPGKVITQPDLKSKTLNLPSRYYRVWTDLDVPGEEKISPLSKKLFHFQSNNVLWFWWTSGPLTILTAC